MDKTLDKKFIVTYSNYFKFENRIFAFRKKKLFDITNIPIFMSETNNNNCVGYWINRKFLSLSKIKEIINQESINVDISDLQWYQQININLAIV